MHMLFTAPQEHQKTYMRDRFFNVFLAYNGFFFPDNATKIQYNDCWDFWDVTINRGILFKEGRGHGTIAQQERHWEEAKKGIAELLGVSLDHSYSSTWEAIDDNTFVDEMSVISNGSIRCPSIRLHVPLFVPSSPAL